MTQKYSSDLRKIHTDTKGLSRARQAHLQAAGKGGKTRREEQVYSCDRKPDAVAVAV